MTRDGEICGKHREGSFAMFNCRINNSKEFPLPKKTGLTLEQHEKLGIELQAMRDKLINISVELSKAYPQKISNVSSRASKTIDILRSELDDKVCQENPSLEEAIKIYYRSNR